ncbi:heterokaryon incompatibility protein-domain-containing protein [Apiospora arundinis]
MRLLCSSTRKIREFLGPSVPPYAILSHTWGEEEVSYQDMVKGLGQGRGLEKIEAACKLAERDEMQYVWVDTCCIDKSSSAELSESINSMFRWYKDSRVCYVYLSDLSPSADIRASLGSCRWTRRGWTLQELIAPARILFFDQEWNYKGDKDTLLEVLSSTTRIDESVLAHKVLLSTISVARRMSWAAWRETTRPEDIAYCLLGIFGINIPLLYGEGANAFIRLQEEIIRCTCDLSIFAWKGTSKKCNKIGGRYSGILAEFPDQFQECSNIVRSKEQWFHADFSVTNRGIRIPISILSLPGLDVSPEHHALALDSRMQGETTTSLGIYLRKCGGDLFVRDHPDRLAMIPPNPGPVFCLRPVYILAKLPEELYDAAGGPGAQDEVQFITRNRVSAVHIVLPSNLTLFDVDPASHYDEEDRVIFSTELNHDGWCVLRIRGVIENSEKCSLRVNCLFACFGWNRQPKKYFVSTLLDISKCELAQVNRFLSEASRAENKSLPWILDELGDFGFPLQGSVILGGNTGQAGPVKLTHTARKVFRPDICNSEIYRIEFYFC